MENQEDQEVAGTKMLPAVKYSDQTEKIPGGLLRTGTVRLEMRRMHTGKHSLEINYIVAILQV